jgi:predicted phosphodiesterase
MPTEIGLISDIHGNAVALDAVVTDLRRRGVRESVCLGDVAAGGPQPGAVMARLRELGCHGVRGNAESWVLDGLPPGRSEETERLGISVAWTRTQLSNDDLDYLRTLPPTLTMHVEHVSLFCFHGSPRSEIESLLATTPDAVLEEALAGAPAASIVTGGHTHMQLLRRSGDRLLVNPGSVGLPLGSLTGEPPLPAWAEYAVVEVDGDDVNVSFHRVSVDREELTAATAAMPAASWAADLERRIVRWNAMRPG